MNKKKKIEYKDNNATANARWDDLIRNYIEGVSSPIFNPPAKKGYPLITPDETDIRDARNAAAEHLGLFGKNGRTVLKDIPFHPLRGSTWYPVKLIKELEPNKWELMLRYLNSDNYDAPYYRN